MEENLNVTELGETVEAATTAVAEATQSGNLPAFAAGTAFGVLVTKVGEWAWGKVTALKEKRKVAKVADVVTVNPTETEDEFIEDESN